MPNWPSARVSNTVAWLLIVATALSFGLGHATNVHNTYLLPGLAKLQPELWAQDWLVQSTFHYHQQFANLVFYLGQFNSHALPWLLVSLDVMLRIVAGWYLFKIVRLLHSRHALLLLSLMVLLIVADKTSSAGVADIYNNLLQPSSVGRYLTIPALFYFLCQRYWISGLLLAFAGFWHTNFLLLLPTYFGAAHLLLRQPGLLYRLTAQLLPCTALILWQLPLFLALAGHPDGQQADYIFQHIRSPHHYVPQTFAVDYLILTGWMVLGGWGAIVLRANQTIDRNISMALTAFMLSSAIILLAATALTSIVYLSVVSKLFFLRFGPFCVLSCQLLALSALLSLCSKSHGSSPTIYWLLAVVGLALLLLGYWFSPEVSGNRFGLLMLGFVGIGLVMVARLIINPANALPSGAAVSLAMIVLTISFQQSFWARSSLLNAGSEYNQRLYQWAQSTDLDAVFLVNPDMANFRLHSRRAIVVDWKSTPIDPSGLLDWYQRVQAVSGITALKDLESASFGYRQMDAQRLRALQQRYQLRYVVFKQPAPATLSALPVAYQNPKFVVYQLNSP